MSHVVTGAAKLLKNTTPYSFGNGLISRFHISTKRNKSFDEYVSSNAAEFQ